MLVRCGLALEYLKVAWKLAGTVILPVAAVNGHPAGRCGECGSVALAGFGVDSLIEIVASAVVVWRLNGTASR